MPAGKARRRPPHGTKGACGSWVCNAGRPVKARHPGQPGALVSPGIRVRLRTCSGAVAVNFRPGYQRLTFPVALIICWNETGGLLWEHLPPDVAPMARMFSL